MKSQLFLLLLPFIFGTIGAQCPEDYREINGECFFFTEADTTESWYGGQLLCELRDGHLAYVNDCKMLGDIIEYIQENDLSNARGFWLGATDLRIEGTFEWINGEPVPMGIPFWGSENYYDEPSGGEEENCLAMNGADNFFFGDLYCDTPLGVICQPTSVTTTPTRTTPIWWVTSTAAPQTTIEPPACPPEYELIGSKCLMFYAEVEDSWSAAELRCQLVEGHLARVDECEELGDIVDYIEYMEYDPSLGFWLGATDIREEGQFEWINEDPVSSKLKLWGSADGMREPNGGLSENCLAIRESDRYYFHDEYCSEKRGLICETSPIMAEPKKQLRSDSANKI